MPGHDYRLDRAAPGGVSKSGVKQLNTGPRPSGGRGNGEVVNLAGQAAGVVDRWRGEQGRDEEAGQLAWPPLSAALDAAGSR